MDVNEHAYAIQAAIQAAYDDGYLLQGWPDDYDTRASQVDLMLVCNRRGEDGVMRNVGRAKIETMWI